MYFPNGDPIRNPRAYLTSQEKKYNIKNPKVYTRSGTLISSAWAYLAAMEANPAFRDQLGLEFQRSSGRNSLNNQPLLALPGPKPTQGIMVPSYTTTQKTNSNAISSSMTKAGASAQQQANNNMKTVSSFGSSSTSHNDINPNVTRLTLRPGPMARASSSQNALMNQNFTRIPRDLAQQNLNQLKPSGSGSGSTGAPVFHVHHNISNSYNYNVGLGPNPLTSHNESSHGGLVYGETLKEMRKRLQKQEEQLLEQSKKIQELEEYNRASSSGTSSVGVTPRQGGMDEEKVQDNEDGTSKEFQGVSDLNVVKWDKTQKVTSKLNDDGPTAKTINLAITDGSNLNENPPSSSLALAVLNDSSTKKSLSRLPLMKNMKSAKVKKLVITTKKERVWVSVKRTPIPKMRKVQTGKWSKPVPKVVKKMGKKTVTAMKGSSVMAMKKTVTSKNQSPKAGSSTAMKTTTAAAPSTPKISAKFTTNTNATTVGNSKSMKMALNATSKRAATMSALVRKPPTTLKRSEKTTTIAGTKTKNSKNQNLMAAAMSPVSKLSTKMMGVTPTPKKEIAAQRKVAAKKLVKNLMKNKGKKK